jgi:hypothetical protein
VILPAYAVEEVSTVYPTLWKYLESRYRLAKESGFGEERLFQVLVDSQKTASHDDPTLGLPCFSTG